MKALAVFRSQGHGVLSRCLKPGFRHVFVAVLNGNYWIMIDGRGGIPDVDVVAPSDYDLAKFYRDQGFTVIETFQRATVPVSLLAIANCVGLAKAILCIRSSAVTPWRLYQHLRKNP